LLALAPLFYEHELVARELHRLLREFSLNLFRFEVLGECAQNFGFVKFFESLVFVVNVVSALTLLLICLQTVNKI
jgi:hypothetical protein